MNELKTFDLKEIDLNKAIKLLEESVFFINQVPNKKYRTRNFEDSYSLASEINKFLNQVEK